MRTSGSRGRGLDQAGLYHPGRSILHRCPAGTKLAGLAAASIALVVWRGWGVLVGAAILLAVGYAVARIPPRIAWSQVRPVRWMLLVIGVLQLLISGWAVALAVVGSIVVLVAAAALVTLTTRVSALMDTLVRILGPLRRIGVDPDRLALLAALTVRAVPVIATIRDEASQARQARGREHSPRALLVPLVIRTVRHADRLGEALIARGVDD